MKIHEYQAKELLAAAGANTPKHMVVRTPEEAASAFDQLSGGGGVMVKAQIHAGGRGAGHSSDTPRNSAASSSPPAATRPRPLPRPCSNSRSRLCRPGPKGSRSRR